MNYLTPGQAAYAQGLKIPGKPDPTPDPAPAATAHEQPAQQAQLARNDGGENGRRNQNLTPGQAAFADRLRLPA